MEPAKDFHGSVVSLRACPVTSLLGFQVTALEILALEPREPRATSNAGAAVVPAAGCHSMKMMQRCTRGFVDPSKMHVFSFRLVSCLQQAGWIPTAPLDCLKVNLGLLAVKTAEL